MDEFIDISEIPYDTREFTMPDLGTCCIRVKPFEDEWKDPVAYVIKDGIEVCTIGILYPYISNSRLTKSDIFTMIEFLNSDIGFSNLYGRKVTVFDGIWSMWIGKNINEGAAISVPNSIPDYTKLF